MIQLLNRNNKLCWHNASVFAVILLVIECGIELPEVTDRDGRETYMTHFKRWCLWKSTKEIDPWDAIGLFVQELSNENVDDIRKNTQEAQFFFFAIAGQELYGLNRGIDFFSFMQPTIKTMVSFDRCPQCEIPGKD